MSLDLFMKEEISDKKEAKEFCIDIDAYEEIKQSRIFRDYYEEYLKDVRERYSENPVQKRLSFFGELSEKERRELFTTTEKVTEKYFYLGERFPVSRN